MAESTISLGIQVDGEKTFNSAISAIDAQIKSLGAATQAAGEQMKTMGGDAEAAARKNELLTQSVAANQEKLRLLSAQYQTASARLAELGRAMQEAQASGDPAAIDRAANAYNRQSVQVSNLAAKISNTEKAIAAANNAMNEGAQAATQEGQAMQQTTGQSDQLTAAVQRMSGIMTAEFAAKAAGMVANAFKQIIDGAIQAGKALLDITTAAGQYADEMATIAAQSNVDVVDLQKWQYASQFIDTEVSAITGALKDLTKNMTSESAASSEAFAQLGISVRDSSGNMRSAEEVMWEAIDALGQVENQTQRDALAMQLFGGSAQQMNPLIQAGSAAFKALGDEAQQAGLILSGEAMNSLGAVDDAMNRVNSSISGVKNAVAVAFAPAVTEIANGANEVVQALIGMVNGTEGSAQKFESAIDNMVNQALSLIDNMLPKVLELGVQVIERLITGISNNIGKITQTITNVVKELLSTITKNLPQILSAGVDILIAVIDGIIQAIPELAANVPKIIEAIVTGLAKLAPKLLEAGKNLIVGLWEGIKGAIGWLWDKIKEALGSVFGWVLDLLGIHSPSTVMRDMVGRNLVLGVAQGITGNADAIQQAWQDAMPDPADLSASVDGVSVAARMADRSGAAVPWRDDRPIILQLNDRELGRAVRGYV